MIVIPIEVEIIVIEIVIYINDHNADGFASFKFW